jgi:hypothetical protein
VSLSRLERQKEKPRPPYGCPRAQNCTAPTRASTKLARSSDAPVAHGRIARLLLFASGGRPGPFPSATTESPDPAGEPVIPLPRRQSSRIGPRNDWFAWLDRAAVFTGLRFARQPANRSLLLGRRGVVRVCQTLPATRERAERRPARTLPFGVGASFRYQRGACPARRGAWLMLWIVSSGHGACVHATGPSITGDGGAVSGASGDRVACGLVFEAERAPRAGA